MPSDESRPSPASRHANDGVVVGGGARRLGGTLGDPANGLR
jgi:hypothetical protein